MNIKLLIDGGSMKPGPAIAQQLGPLGINMGKVISDVNSATSDFKGMKVPVELNINEKTKSFTVKTFSPPTSELLKKELNLEKGTADHKKVKVGNASIEDIIKITKIKFPDMLQKEFKSAVKSVLGTCKSIGILVENSEAKDLIKEVEGGKFDSEIRSQKTETLADKRKELNGYFDSIKKKQEAEIAREKAEAEEAAKAAPAAGTAPAAGATPAAGTAPAGKSAVAAEPSAKAVPAAKAEDKKAKK
ncbi:MAG: 50S ribosomal protein L11 [Candidatus Nanoarchaeia archaeon]|nr:50S ribosomal protein L11 [Candidatus Nanoarchaeia archaeon]MDD5740873.1 50S ribosomal protein L11 [Candidatus Nanoarchaeia archaeon]